MIAGQLPVEASVVTSIIKSCIAAHHQMVWAWRGWDNAMKFHRNAAMALNKVSHLEFGKLTRRVLTWIVTIHVA
jgi:hypothetical protein